MMFIIKICRQSGPSIPPLAALVGSICWKNLPEESHCQKRGSSESFPGSEVPTQTSEKVKASDRGGTSEKIPRCRKILNRIIVLMSWNIAHP